MIYASYSRVSHALIKNMQERIAITFPSNFGDVIMALPLLDRVKANYPASTITAIVSPQTKEFLSRNNFIDEVLIYDKKWRLPRLGKFAFSLIGRYDIFVDLKNTIFPFIAATKKRTPFVRNFPKNLHIRQQYLSLIRDIAPKKEAERSTFSITKEERDALDKFCIPKSVFIACSSLSNIKCYEYECLKEVIDYLRAKYPIVVVGQERDRRYYGDILSLKGVIDLVGKTKDIARLPTFLPITRGYY